MNPLTLLLSRSFLLLFLLLFLQAGIAQEAEYAGNPDNPKPAPDDLVLPMPGGGSMVFRSVYLGLSDHPTPGFAGRRFRMGDSTKGDFKESPTEVMIGGSFQGEWRGKEDWCFHLGKYEVTERQWSLIMTPEEPSESTMPVTDISWLEVQTFLFRYNEWLLSQARDSLPSLDGVPGFLRLPIEAEWEFAARGGVVADANTFDLSQPHGRDLIRHESFSGPRSSHDRKKRVGTLRPNLLGLHDMLGNVAEMTMTPYQIEYFQGRTGGITIRGGSFLTSDREMRSSLRNELPLHQPDGSPAKQRTLGFRLTISSPVFTSNPATKALQDAWPAYQKVRGGSSTAVRAIDSTAGKASYSLNDAVTNLERLEQAVLALPNPPETMLSSLGLLKATFGDVESLIYVAERESAAAWARMASYNAFFLYREQQKIPASEKVIEISKTTGNAAQLRVYEERHQNLLQNISDSRSQYGVIITELGKSSKEAALNGFAVYENYLIELGLTEQLRIHSKSLAHYEEYHLSKRLNLDAWIEQLASL